MSLLDDIRGNSPRLRNSATILKSFHGGEEAIQDSFEKARKELDPNGRWVTINGQHVHLSSGGNVDAGRIYGQDNKGSKDHTTKTGGKEYSQLLNGLTVSTVAIA